MRFAEQLTLNSQRYFETRNAARRHNPVGVGKSHGILRDRAERRANENYRNGLKKLGLYRSRSW